MISIHSAEENKFAIDLANRDLPTNNDVWIGAKRRNSVDYFEWTNGQKFNYSNWENGEPKNSTDPELHVKMNSDGTWAALGISSNGNWYIGLVFCESNLSDECLNKQEFILSNNFLKVL